ncbi:endonuclease/exonuclease/phosphatase family protein [Streptomyces sp. NPDC057675]|uniref:endonuclease/exonuclease/phosphatase family protein n=1 Tax=Streptomyces sp. NPDC057675 TaxID=3346204 RepID=UPI0036B81B23
MQLPRRLVAQTAAVAMLSTMPLLATAGEAAADGGTGETYKVMTYNIQGLPLLAMDQADAYGMVEEDRAHKIADKVLHDNYDIITFNEAFDEDMRKTLVDDLSGTYPYNIPFIDADGVGTPGAEDSGLMLFSKFPFENLPEKEMSNPRDACIGQVGDDCKAYFHLFPRATGSDLLSDKGVGYARIKNTVTGRPLDLYFSHTQAFNTSQDVIDRADQLKRIASFAERTSDPQTRDSIIMGDLNVSSDLKAGSPTPTAEYEFMSDQFVPIGYTDTQKYTSPSDRQYSFSDRNTQNAGGDAQDGADDERLDYIWFRQAKDAQDAPSCVQHSWLQKQMYFRGTVDDEYVATDLSDHYGLAAVIGRDGQYCSPSLAKPNPSNGNHYGSIAHQGSYQWYRFDAGAYRFRTLADNNAPMQLTAFYRDDLATPLTPFEGTGNLPNNDHSVTFAPNKPFYVRVSALTNPSWTGDYRLTIEKLDGRTKDTAVPIDPYQKLDAYQMSPDTQNPMSKVWYTYKQHELKSGAKQNLSFQTTEQSAGLKLNIQALDSSGLPFNPNRQSVGSTGTNRLDLTKANSPISGAEQKLYFTVNREGSTLGSFKIERTTDYRWAMFGSFFNADQQDPVVDDGDDEPWMRTWVDGGAGITDGFGDVDERQRKDAPAWMDAGFGFSDQITINMWEADEEDANEDMGTVTLKAPAAGTETSSHLTFMIPDDAEWYYYYLVKGNIDD